MCLPQLLVVFLLCIKNLWTITLGIVLNLTGRCIKQRIFTIGKGRKAADSWVWLTQLFWTIVGARDRCSLKIMSCGAVLIFTRLFPRTWPGVGKTGRFNIYFLCKYSFLFRLQILCNC
eukprot:UN02909